jgi:predicted transcriptional regulator
MAISNELSSEIAAAILAENKTPQELDRLKDVILRVHTTLQELSEEVREARSKDRITGLTKSACADSTAAAT